MKHAGEGVLGHWRALRPEQQRLCLGGLLVVVLAGILLARSLDSADGGRARADGADWMLLWRDLREIPLAEPLDEAAWRAAVPSLMLSEVAAGDSAWRLAGRAPDLGALERLRNWAEARGWQVQDVSIEARDGVDFRLQLVALLVRGQP